MNKEEYIIKINDNEISVSKELYNTLVPFGKIINKLQQENNALKSQLDFISEQNKYINKLEQRIDNQEFLLKSQGKELKELYLIIDKAIKYLEQPNRDNFDFSKANLLEILKGEK